MVDEVSLLSSALRRVAHRVSDLGGQVDDFRGRLLELAGRAQTASGNYGDNVAALERVTPVADAAGFYSRFLAGADGLDTKMRAADTAITTVDGISGDVLSRVTDRAGGAGLGID